MELIRNRSWDYEKEFIFKLDEKIKGYKELLVSIYYSKGGMNYFTSRTEERGYYISITPCKLGDISITSSPFDGLKMMIKGVTRKSKKSFSECVNDLGIANFMNLSKSFYYGLSDDDIWYMYNIIKGKTENH